MKCLDVVGRRYITLIPSGLLQSQEESSRWDWKNVEEFDLLSFTGHFKFIDSHYSWTAHLQIHLLADIFVTFQSLSTLGHFLGH